MGRAARATAAAAARLRWEAQSVDAAGRARAVEEGAYAAVSERLATRATATPTTLETIRREMLRDTGPPRGRPGSVRRGWR